MFNIGFQIAKWRRFKWWHFNKRYMTGYNFALENLNKKICIRCLVSGSVGPDNHDEGLRDACSDFTRFYSKKVKQNCKEQQVCKV